MRAFANAITILSSFLLLSRAVCAAPPDLDTGIPSPDGKRVLIRVAASAGGGGQSRVVVRDRASGREIELAEPLPAGIETALWSPDSAKIALDEHVTSTNNALRIVYVGGNSTGAQARRSVVLTALLDQLNDRTAQTALKNAQSFRLTPVAWRNASTVEVALHVQPSSGSQPLFDRRYGFTLGKGWIVAAGTTPVRNDFLLVGGVRVGPIHRGMSEADLRRIFGAREVVSKMLDGAEGDTIDGAVVFPGTPDRIEIFWGDAKHTRIDAVRLNTRGGRWHTASGVRVGMPLRDLVRINNQKPITFSGFDWDYGGFISSYGGGPLDTALGKRSKIALRLNYAPEHMKHVGEKRAMALVGDKPVSSANPVVQIAAPYIDEITVAL